MGIDPPTDHEISMWRLMRNGEDLKGAGLSEKRYAEITKFMSQSAKR